MTVVWVDRQGNRYERSAVMMVSVFPDLAIIYPTDGPRFDVVAFTSITTVEETDNEAA